jgi:hypothetical protein
MDKEPSKEDLDVYNVVGAFAPELALLDTVDPQNDVFQTGVVAAALLSLALDTQLIGYFDQLSKREGSKRKGLLDPVEALLSMVGSLKEGRGAWGKAQQQELCAAALTGAFAWKAGDSHPHYWVKEALPAADIQEIAHQVRELKGLPGGRFMQPATHRGE